MPEELWPEALWPEALWIAVFAFLGLGHPRLRAFVFKDYH
jgi:hypothetical protein